MSKNYKIGSKVRVTSNSTNGFNIGEIVNLVSRRLDGLFEMDNGEFQQTLYEDQFELVCEPASSKLKPAKQALADAIHQNGGWKGGLFAIFGKLSGRCVFCENKPHFCRESKGWFVNADSVVGEFDMKPFVNWHQTCLSRDEYLAAYPEQNVEVKNETHHKVEVEMKSESELTIKVDDWHKNGELPPVGEVVMLNSTNPNDYWAHHVGVELTVVAHDKDSRGVEIAVYRFVDAAGYNEYHGLVAHAFKPLRTERDKAIDEIVDCLSSRWANCEEIAAHLYENGYRKEVK